MLKNGEEMLLTYSGRFVEVHGVLGRKLFSLLDGTRDHAALAAAIRDFLSVEHAAARARGEEAKLPSPDDPAIDEQLRRSLTGLAALDLLRRD
jgi:hypothetical protein